MALKRRYEIFVSSTYLDLREERRFLYQFIVQQGHIPTGMELFDAGNENVWSVITQEIDRCDGYVLLIAARYGSVDKRGRSYTEREYQYAKKTGKRVAALILSKPGLSAWPKQLCERDAASKLNAFRSRIDKGVINEWNDSSQLSEVIREKLPNWIHEAKGGWVRAEELDVAEAERHVYRYLFNQFTPLRLGGHGGIGDKLTPIESMGAVVGALEVLIREYVPLLVQKEIGRQARSIRVYFAYKLRGPEQLGTAGEAAYRIGISTSAGEHWQEGLAISRDSNTHRVYVKGELIAIRDTHNPAGRANQFVEGERSVLGAPVKYLTHTVGVIGLSSPQEGGVTPLKPLAADLSNLFAALFYAYGQCLTKGGSDPERIHDRIRNELAEQIDAALGH
jgi:Domain of unknown function (DUF4062)